MNNIDVSIIRVAWLRRQMSLVSQEPDLFNMTIAGNIRYGALYREVSDEEVIEAAKSANIHEFVISLPQVSTALSLLLLSLTLAPPPLSNSLSL